jgi:hypothetical protein
MPYERRHDIISVVTRDLIEPIEIPNPLRLLFLIRHFAVAIER